MKIEKITTQTQELEITGATLLSIEEAKALPLRLREYENWWWLRSTGSNSSLTACVSIVGSVYYFGYVVDLSHLAVRPALKINLTPSNLRLQIGDVFIFGGKKFEIISEELAFCLEDIGEYCFRENWQAEDANDYEASDIKKYIDRWFEDKTK